MFNNIFSLPISEGGLHELLGRLVQKALPAYESIKDRIAASGSVGADETGTKVDG